MIIFLPTVFLRAYFMTKLSSFTLLFRKSSINGIISDNSHELLIPRSCWNRTLGMSDSMCFVRYRIVVVCGIINEPVSDSSSWGQSLIIGTDSLHNFRNVERGISLIEACRIRVSKPNQLHISLVFS